MIWRWEMGGPRQGSQRARQLSWGTTETGSGWQYVWVIRDYKHVKAGGGGHRHWGYRTGKSWLVDPNPCGVLSYRKGRETGPTVEQGGK